MNWPPDNRTVEIILQMTVPPVILEILVTPLAQVIINRDKVITKIIEVITEKIISVEAKGGEAKVGDIKAKDKIGSKTHLNQNKTIIKTIIGGEVKEAGEGDNHKRDTPTLNIMRDKANIIRIHNTPHPLHHLQHNHRLHMIQIGN